MIDVRAVLGRYPHTEGLFDASSLGLDGTTLRTQLREDTPSSAPRMLNDLEFDVCEMPIASYLVAKQCGVKVTALPVFLTRGFDHRRIICNRATGVREARDLEGRRVGIRYYGFTDGMWVKGALSETDHVDLDQVTWVTCDAENVTGATLPANVDVQLGADLTEMLKSREIAALILNAGQDVVGDDIEPLYPDVAFAEETWFASTGVYPIHHTVVVREQLLDMEPQLAGALVDAFSRAKEEFLYKLDSGEVLSDGEQRLAATRQFMGRDPLPYGIEANRTALDMTVRFGAEQHLIAELLPIEEFFYKV